MSLEEFPDEHDLRWKIIKLLTKDDWVIVERKNVFKITRKDTYNYESCFWTYHMASRYSVSWVRECVSNFSDEIVTLIKWKLLTKRFINISSEILSLLFLISCFKKEKVKTTWNSISLIWWWVKQTWSPVVIFMRLGMPPVFHAFFISTLFVLPALTKDLKVKEGFVFWLF